MIRNRILVLRLSALGDVIHTLPAVLALAQTFQSTVRLGWAVEPALAELVEIVAPVDAVFRVPTKKWRRDLWSGATCEEVRVLIRELRSFSRGETAIDFQGLAKSAILGVVSGARARFGFARGLVREGISGLFYNKRVTVDPNLHVVEWNLALARAAGARFDAPPRPDLSAFASDADGSLAKVVAERPLVLLPGAGRPEKHWNIDRFALLAERASKSLGLEPVVAWGPGERHLAESIVSKGAAKLAPPTDLRQLAFLLKKARLVVAGDTGPLHLADALGTPVVGLFGPTSPQRNGPYHQLDHCVESWSSSRTMNALSVDAVMQKVQEVLR